MIPQLKETIDVLIVLMGMTEGLYFSVKKYDVTDYHASFIVDITHKVDWKEPHHISINWNKYTHWEVWSDKIDSWTNDSRFRDYNYVRFYDTFKLATYLYHLLHMYKDK